MVNIDRQYKDIYGHFDVQINHYTSTKLLNVGLTD